MALSHAGGRFARHRPRRPDYNLVIVGGGAAGLVAASVAAATRARVALVEAHRLGGDCLYTGCVPSKALVEATRLLARMAGARTLGLVPTVPDVSFSDVMARIRRVIAAIEPHDSEERYRRLGVEVIRGRARLTSPWSVEVSAAAGTRTLTARSLILATGSRPVVPAIPGLAEAGCLTTDTIWQLGSRPDHLLVMGGGPAGCELAQAFARLGSRVTIVECADRLLPREDPEASALVRHRFEAEGVRVLTRHQVVRVFEHEGRHVVEAATAGGVVRLPCDAILAAVGRVAGTEGLGLDTLGIGTTPAGTIQTNEHLQTVYPHIYACGDVAGPYALTHAATHQARCAAVNALFGGLRRRERVPHVVPWATFTDPEIARVGLTDAEARERDIPHVVSVHRLADVDRAIAGGETTGFIKVLTRPRTDRILGVTCVGYGAAELLPEWVIAMTHGLGIERVLDAVHVYPTFADANRLAAAAWKRATVTRGQQRFLDALHTWRRGATGLWTVLSAIRPLVRDRTPALSSDITGGNHAGG